MNVLCNCILPSKSRQLGSVIQPPSAMGRATTIAGKQTAFTGVGVNPGLIGKVKSVTIDSEPGGVQVGKEENCITKLTVFFAVFEGVTLYALLSWFWELYTLGEPAIIINLLCGFCFHLVTQYVMQKMDIGGVQQALQSMEETVDKETTANILDELRALPPQIILTAEAFHNETRRGTGNNTTTETIIDHQETATFHFGSWSDISGKLIGLEKYKIVSIAVLPEYICADEETDLSLRELEKSLINICRQFRDSVRSVHSVRLAHPRYPVQDRRVFVTMARGMKRPFWLSSRMYQVFRFGCPFLGTVYRWLFHNSVVTVRYRLVKRVSVMVASDAV